MGVDGISFPLVIAHVVRQHVGDGGQLADHQARQSLLHPVPAVGNRHAGRVSGARLLPVLRVLGSDAAADVLSDRRVGRPAARICGDQVLPLHAVGQRADADRHSDAVFQQRPDGSLPTEQLVAATSLSQARTRAAQAIAQDPRRDGRSTRSTSWRCSKMGQHTDRCSNDELLWGKSAAVVGVRAAVHRLCHQGAGRAVAHLVARRARRGPHADLDDPGRRAAEDGRLRHHPHLLSDLSRRGLRSGLCRLRHRRVEHGLWRVRGPGPEGFQAAGGLQLGEPHGLRRAGHRRLERRWLATTTTPSIGRWA